MKKLLTIFVLIAVFVSLSYGDNTHIRDITTQIQKLINEVKIAPPSERYKKMNQLKLLIKKLNNEERIKIMKKIHKQLHSSHERMNREYMHKHYQEHFSHREHMEMRNMRKHHEENMRKEMHDKRKRRWGDRDKGNRNKGEHNRPWNHFR